MYLGTISCRAPRRGPSLPLQRALWHESCGPSLCEHGVLHCVFSGIVMLGGFVVLPCGTREMFRCFPVVFGSSVRHVNFSEAF
jgi:hypothetical protein